MNIELVAVVRRIIHTSRGSRLYLTSVDMIYPDGRDCGVPMFVEGYEGASKLLMKFGVGLQELKEHRAEFQRHSKVCFPVKADAAVVREMGFNPR